MRGQKVMLDHHLAELYGVKTKALNQAVKRNRTRFPEDFMFQLTKAETAAVLGYSRSQLVTLKQGLNVKYSPYAFTEQGIAMLSSVLNSEKAIQVNIAIMRVFIKLKQILSSHKELAQKLIQLEDKFTKHDADIQSIFALIRKIMLPPEKSKRPIGFRPNHD